MCGYDMLHAISSLGARLSKWTVVQDRQLHRLMCYVRSTLDWSQHAWIGDIANDVNASLFADADFAGDPSTSKSASGVHLCLIGPSSHFSLEGQSKRQLAVANSTPEAEIAAAAYAVGQCGLPFLDLIQQI